jgi:hypothetical protein
MENTEGPTPAAPLWIHTHRSAGGGQRQVISNADLHGPIKGLLTRAALGLQPDDSRTHSLLKVFLDLQRARECANIRPARGIPPQARLVHPGWTAPPRVFLCAVRECGSLLTCRPGLREACWRIRGRSPDICGSKLPHSCGDRADRLLLHAPPGDRARSALDEFAGSAKMPDDRRCVFKEDSCVRSVAVCL